jgi:hypothetical protein
MKTVNARVASHRAAARAVFTAAAATWAHVESGAIDGSCTRDPQDHNLLLCWLSYDRHKSGAR